MVPPTIGRTWCRGTDILNDALCIGPRVWNRQGFVNDPRTGKRIDKPNSEAERTIDVVPDLWLLADGLWREINQ